MRKRMSLAARRELLKSVRSRYEPAGRKEKQRMLDEVVATTGYHRKHVISIMTTIRTYAELGVRHEAHR